MDLLWVRAGRGPAVTMGAGGAPTCGDTERDGGGELDLHLRTVQEPQQQSLLPSEQFQTI